MDNGYIILIVSSLQWRRQGLMVGEAHLAGVADIFNVKYIRYPRMRSTYYLLTAARYIHTYLYTYTGSQYILGQAQMNPFPLPNSYRYLLLAHNISPSLRHQPCHARR